MRLDATTGNTPSSGGAQVGPDSRNAEKCVQYFAKNKTYDEGSLIPIKAKFAYKNSAEFIPKAEPNEISKYVPEVEPNAINDYVPIAEQMEPPSIVYYDVPNLNYKIIDGIMIDSVTDDRYYRVCQPILINDSDTYYSAYYVYYEPEFNYVLIPSSN